MRIFDENRVLLESPDLTKGRIIEMYSPIIHRYKVIKQEVGHYETVRVYPNGGKDVEWVVDIAEEGHWVTYDMSGNEIQTSNIVPSDAPHEQPIQDHEVIGVYIPYTQAEIIDQ